MAVQAPAPRRSFAARFAQAAAAQAIAPAPAQALPVAPIPAPAQLPGAAAPLVGRVDIPVPAAPGAASVRRSLAGRFAQAAVAQAAPRPAVPVVQVAPAPRPAAPGRLAARFLTARAAAAPQAPRIRPPGGLRETLQMAADEASRDTFGQRQTRNGPYLQAVLQSHILRFNADGQDPIKRSLKDHLDAANRNVTPQNTDAIDYITNNGSYDLVAKICVEEMISSLLPINPGNTPACLASQREALNRLRTDFQALSAANQILVRTRLHQPGAALDQPAQGILQRVIDIATNLVALSEQEDGVRVYPFRRVALGAIDTYLQDHPIGNFEQVIIEAPAPAVVEVAPQRPPGPPFPEVNAATLMLVDETAINRAPTPIDFDEIRRKITEAEREGGAISFDELLTQYDRIEDQAQRTRINAARAAAQLDLDSELERLARRYTQAVTDGNVTPPIRRRAEAVTEARRQQALFEAALVRRNAAAAGSQAYKDAVRGLEAAVRARNAAYQIAGCLAFIQAIVAIDLADPRVLLSGYVDYLKREFIRSDYDGDAAQKEAYRRNHFDELALFAKGSILQFRDDTISIDKKIAAFARIFPSGYDPLAANGQGNCDPGKKVSGEDSYKMLLPGGDNVEQTLLNLLYQHKRELFVQNDLAARGENAHTPNMLAYVSTRIGNRIGTPPTSGERADPYSSHFLGHHLFPPHELVDGVDTTHSTDAEMMAFFHKLYTKKPEDVIAAVHSGATTEGGIAAMDAGDRIKIAQKIAEILRQAVEANSINLEEATRRQALYITGLRGDEITPAGVKFLLKHYGLLKIRPPIPAIVAQWTAFQERFEQAHARITEAVFNGRLPVPEALPNPAMFSNGLTDQDYRILRAAYLERQGEIEAIRAINDQRSEHTMPLSIRFHRALMETTLQTLEGPQRPAFVNLLRPLVQDTVNGSSPGLFGQQATQALALCMCTAQIPGEESRNFPSYITNRARVRALCRQYQGLSEEQQAQVLSRLYEAEGPIDPQARDVWTEFRAISSGIYASNTNFRIAVRGAGTGLVLLD